MDSPALTISNIDLTPFRMPQKSQPPDRRRRKPQSISVPLPAASRGTALLPASGPDVHCRDLACRSLSLACHTQPPPRLRQYGIVLTACCGPRDPQHPGHLLLRTGSTSAAAAAAEVSDRRPRRYRRSLHERNGLLVDFFGAAALVDQAHASLEPALAARGYLPVPGSLRTALFWLAAAGCSPPCGSHYSGVNL